MLFSELHVLHDTQRQVGLRWQDSDGIGKYHRRVVTGVAILEVAVCQIQDAAEECDKHIGIIHLRKAVVHIAHYAFGTAFVGGYCAE